jgi:hypothetical protein
MSPLPSLDFNALAEQIAERVAQRLADRAPTAAPVVAEWLDTKGAAEYLGLAPITLELMRTQRRGPTFHKPTRSVVRYRRSELDTWLAGGGKARKS